MYAAFLEQTVKVQNASGGFVHGVASFKHIFYHIRSLQLKLQNDPHELQVVCEHFQVDANESLLLPRSVQCLFNVQCDVAHQAY